MSGADAWDFLRKHTEARIALGRAGDGLPTSAALAFQMAHAQARDAVHAPFDPDILRTQMKERGITLPVTEVQSQAPDRATYLQRPDLGRLLATDAALPETDGCDVAFVIGDGLSATAVHAHAAATLAATLAHLEGWTPGPVVLARQARVALADPIGERLGAKLTVMLIGERPGLSAADSLGAYLTFAPRPGRQNAERNCVSNIRAAGLPPEAAGFKIAWLLNKAREMGLTGVALKDDAPAYLPGRDVKEIEGR